MSVGLTEQQRQQLFEHLNRTWRTAECPMCHSNDWSIDGVHSVLLTENIRNWNMAGPMLPCATVSCQVCGNTLFINLLTAGVYAHDDGG